MPNRRKIQFKTPSIITSPLQLYRQISRFLAETKLHSRFHSLILSPRSSFRSMVNSKLVAITINVPRGEEKESKKTTAARLTGLRLYLSKRSCRSNYRCARTRVYIYIYIYTYIRGSLKVFFVSRKCLGSAYKFGQFNWPWIYYYVGKRNSL